MRLLFITRERFPTFRVDIDVLFSQVLSSRGHSIELVMQAASGAQPAGRHSWHAATVLVGKGVDVTGPGSAILREVLSLFHDVTSILSLRRQRVDAIQVRDKFAVAVIALIVARIRRQRFFFWLSFPVPEAQRQRAREGNARFPVLTFLRGFMSSLLLYRVILPFCDHAFVQSEQMRRDLADAGADASKLTAVPMGISDEDIESLARAAEQHVANVQDGFIRLGYLGTLNSSRHLEILVDVLARVRGEGVDAHLLLIGDGERPADRGRIEARAKELDVDAYMSITGMLPRQTAIRMLQSVDIAMSPFFPTPILSSTSPTKLVEYMAAGIPVVANTHPEQKLVLRQSGAGVIVPWGGRHFARAVRWLALLPEKSRRQMGAKGQLWVRENRSYEKIAETLDKVYGRFF